MAMMTMTGCDPQLNIAGAYFPAWLLCMIVGLLSFWVIHLVFLRTGMIPFLLPIPSLPLHLCLPFPLPLLNLPLFLLLLLLLLQLPTLSLPLLLSLPPPFRNPRILSL